MTRDRLLKRLAAAWQDFEESYANLSESQVLQPGVTGNWSVRDIIAHVTWWEEEALEHLPHIREGGRPPRYSVKYGGIDAFNALMTEKRRGLSLAQVLLQHDEVHDRLVAYIGSVPEELFTAGTRFRRRLRLDTYSHYPIHASAIRLWRAREVQP
ncbi:MAG: DinB family protein [Longimicrobiales bacterium]